MDSKVIKTRLGDIEYISIGKGIPVVFIHGGHSNCYETLSHKGFDLSNFQLISPSRPGYGKTPLNGNRTPRQAADLISELLNHLSLEEVIVYGISGGGLTAIELAVNFPEKVSKLILASAISKKWLSHDEKTYKIARVIFNPAIERVIWTKIRFFAKVLPRMVAKSFYSQFSSYPTHKLSDKDIQEFILALKLYRSKRGFLNDLDQSIDLETIENVQCPTLVIHSKYDNSVSFEHANHSKRAIRNSRLVELENEWGHLFWIGKDSEMSISQTIKFIEE